MPRAKIVWLAGNHEERLPNYLMDNARAAFGLHQAGDTEGWPVLSVPHLCRFEEQGVEYLPGYPASHGCIRLASASIDWLATRIGPGTPVTIEQS